MAHERILCTRREFLHTASAVAVGMAMPTFLVRSAAAATEELGGPIPGFKDDRILVVVQLSGGNDGLNTLVPFSDDAYYRARPRIGLKEKDIIKITGDLAFNASMKPFKDLADQGKLAIIEGVGYPNPNRSHFRSMEIWQTGVDSDRYSDTGWIGRYLDNSCSGSAVPEAATAVSGERPQAFSSKKGFGVAFQDPQTYSWTEGHGDAKEQNFKLMNAVAQPHNDTLDFLRKITNNAVLSSDRVREIARKYRGGVDYPKEAFANSLQTVAKMIAGGLGARIYYVTLTGFDTHANQLNSHNNLLQRFTEGVAAFQKDMETQGNADRVLIASFSEFGRRVGENASSGTDHGTAAPMFLVGSMINAGMAGKRPSLTDLDNGDLKYTTDFRSIYASVLEQWLGADSKIVMGKQFGQVGLIQQKLMAKPQVAAL